MNGGGDVFTTLSWGLRRYAWVLVMFVVGIGILVPVLQIHGADSYEAQAQVGPTQELKLPNLDPLPRLGDTVFNNGAVADSVRHFLKLPTTASVVPSRVLLVAAQDNIVFTVVGRGPSPESARDLANLAAATFTLELNRYSASVGEFIIQRGAEAPAKPVPSLGRGYLALLLGLVAGVIAGVGAVALLLVLRRPVVDAATAENAAGAPVMGRIRLPRRGAEINESGVMGIALLCRRVLSSAPEVILLASPLKEASQLRQLGTAMGTFLDKVSRGSTRPRDDSSSPAADSPSDDAREPARRHPEVVVLDGPSLEQWARRPDESELTLLVVPVGIGVKRLRHTADAYFTGGPAGLVVVAKQKRRRGRSRKSRSSATKEPGADNAEQSARSRVERAEITVRRN